MPRARHRHRLRRAARTRPYDRRSARITGGPTRRAARERASRACSARRRLMPRVIDAPAVQACTLGECLAALEASGFDPSDEASLLHAAHWLRRLGSNRDFLAERLLAELEARHREDDLATAYGPQVI